MFVVEVNVPQVSSRGRRAGPSKFPLHEMDVGDSFLIPCDGSKKALDSWRRKLLTAKKRMSSGTWATAQVEGGLRVWRTE